MSALDTLYEHAHRRLRVLPGLIVLAVVLVLLHDVSGAIESLRELIADFLTAIVGGGDHAAVANVLWRTLPLSLAAGGVTFVVANRWIRPGSSHSYVWVSLIVLAGAIVGNACYEKFGSQTVVIAEPTTSLPQDRSIAKNLILKPSTLAQAVPATNNEDAPPTTLAKALALADEPRIEVAAVRVQPNAWHRIAAIRWLDKPDLSRKPKPVEPLEIVPHGPGIFRGVSGAINQLLGYLVDYEPRLFLASIIAGSFVGWRLQRRVVVAHAVVSGDFSELSEGEVERLAA
ncbi:MAG: hypothetical protein ACR2NU_14230 [Aeoliella sp.]